MTTIHSFVPLEKLGTGSFSSVYKVRRISDGNIYALKKIKVAGLKKKELSNALNQIRILASLQSPYIVTYKQAFYDEQLNLLCIVMQWANQGDVLLSINSQIKNKTNFSQKQIWTAIYQILTGLLTLHKNNILHRDLKSANIFIGQNKYKIGDLNVSKVNHDQRMVKTQTGTPYYASPQVWRDQPYDHKSDIWSFGCIIYEMCALTPPFQGENLQQLYKSIQLGIIKPIPSIYSLDLFNFIKKCLHPLAYDRPSVQQLLNNNILNLKCSFYDIKTDNRLQIRQPLLQTIQTPNDMKILNQKLPTSKYQDKNKLISESILKFQSQKSTLLIQNKNHQKKPPLGKQQKINNDNNDKIIRNQSLPVKIRNHLNQIRDNNISKQIIRRPKPKIPSTSFINRQKCDQSLNILNNYSNIKRPISCQIKNKPLIIKSNIRIKTASKQIKNRYKDEVFKSLQKSQQMYQKVKKAQNSYLIRRQVRQDVILNRQRCKSTSSYKSINKSNQQSVYKINNRQLKQINKNKYYILNNNQSSLSHKKLFFDANMPQYYNGGSVKKIIKNNKEDRKYLQQIQNKILSGSIKGKKCPKITTTSVVM